MTLIAAHSVVPLHKSPEGSVSEVEIEAVDESEEENEPNEADDVLARVTRNTMLIDTENLISKNSEMIEKIQSQLRLEKQPYKDHCYPVLVKG